MPRGRIIGATRLHLPIADLDPATEPGMGETTHAACYLLDGGVYDSALIRDLGLDKPLCRRCLDAVGVAP